MSRLALLGLLTSAWLCLGCEHPKSLPSGHVVNPQRDQAKFRVSEFDFGSLLALGQKLQHTFTITNPAVTPLRLLKAAATVPCCSTIGPIPEFIPPGASTSIPTTLNTIDKSGLIHVDFRVDTDQDPIRLRLTVNLVPDYQKSTENMNPAFLYPGQAGKASFRIYCRRFQSEGLPLPSSVDVSGPITASISKSIGEQLSPEGILEATAQVEVELNPTFQPGIRTAAFILRWPDGHTQTERVTWQVRLHITAHPSGLVVKSSKTPANVTIFLTSDDSPFTITEVIGPFAGPVAYSTSAERKHSLTFAIEPRTSNATPVLSINIRTDRPEQPTISLPVLITSSSEG